MKIILLKSVPKLGLAGETKDVNEGYARNYLIPKGMADIATRHSVNMLDSMKKKIARFNLLAQKNKEKLIKTVNGKKIVVNAKADAKGTLYAGLDKKVLSGELKALGYEIEPEAIKMKEAIKKLGKKRIELKINEKKAIINLEIISK